ncbi:MAG: RluA family pseudouridine synthase, partial [Lachnospiraceae bacterium]|nr:RluA family pseudouridine synthase [Lachnospiraceae bacterium]
EYFREKGEPHEVRSAGRLDKDTSGVILFAKSRTAAAVLNGQTPLRGVEKEYLALAEGIFENDTGIVDAPISREYEEKIRRVVRDDGAPARTHFRVIRQFDGYALISVKIETGRTHQIRVHMAHTGHPLVGDPIYGHGTEGATRALLHAYRASFVQPFTHREMEMTAPLPKDFAEKCGAFLSGELESFTYMF